MQHAIDYAALPEAEVVASAKAGDHEAFRAIMQRHNQRLFRVARGLMRDDADAEDVLQEAYVRAFAHIESFRGEAAIATWLTRIVINEARTRLRSRKPTVELEAVEAAQEAGAQLINFPGRATSDPEADVAKAQIRRLLEGAVDELPETFRVVFILRDVEGLSIEDTAAQLGIKAETVKTRLHRARRLLRQALHSQLETVLTGAFPFLGARCERITNAVLSRLRLPAEASA
jgi:RNA polymerase sigma factor (sigma-70 family)